MKTIGFVVNPIAGMGGAVGLKGTDGAAYQEAVTRGALPRSPLRAQGALDGLCADPDDVRIVTCAGAMGADALVGAGLACEVAYHPHSTSTACDTIAACRSFARLGVDAIVFCGGDGTARNVLEAVGDNIPILGIPSGVKMYSSVFAISPHAAREVITAFVASHASVCDASVLDIDEEKYRCGVLDRKLYGYAKALYIPRCVQGPKCAFYSKDEDDSKSQIARFATEFMSDGSLYVLGVGSTTKAIADALGIEKTLLGIDLVQDGRLVASDVTEQDILAATKKHERVKIIVSPLGAQGFVFGRGNHQISSKVLALVGRENVIVVGTPKKLQETPMFYVDTGDDSLDHELSGDVSVVCGYKLAARKRICCG